MDNNLNGLFTEGGMCIVNTDSIVHRLEKMKTNDAIGYFTRKYKSVINGEDDLEKTEFIVGDNRKIVTNKKIMKEVQDGDKVHIKVLNYNEIIDEEESE